MKKLLVVLDDETASLLEKKINKSAFVRESVRYMSMDISTDTVDGMRKSYKILTRQLAELNQQVKELDSKIDFIAGKIS